MTLVVIALAFGAGWALGKYGWQDIKTWAVGIAGVVAGFLQNFGVTLPF